MREKRRLDHAEELANLRYAFQHMSEDPVSRQRIMDELQKGPPEKPFLQKFAELFAKLEYGVFYET